MIGALLLFALNAVARCNWVVLPGSSMMQLFNGWNEMIPLNLRYADAGEISIADPKLPEEEFTTEFPEEVTTEFPEAIDYTQWCCDDCVAQEFFLCKFLCNNDFCPPPIPEISFRCRVAGRTAYELYCNGVCDGAIIDPPFREGCREVCTEEAERNCDNYRCRDLHPLCEVLLMKCKAGASNRC